MTRGDLIRRIVGEKRAPARSAAKAYAPSNIALCKYWGKRNTALNLPVTSSLSISLGELGSTTTVECADADEVTLNGDRLSTEQVFYQRLFSYVNEFRKPEDKLRITTNNTIPTAVGLASSASGFAAIVMALDELYGWDLDIRDLSILARMGSGSACRSIEQGLENSFNSPY